MPDLDESRNTIDHLLHGLLPLSSPTSCQLIILIGGLTTGAIRTSGHLICLISLLVCKGDWWI